MQEMDKLNILIQILPLIYDYTDYPFELCRVNKQIKLSTTKCKLSLVVKPKYDNGQFDTNIFLKHRFKYLRFYGCIKDNIHDSHLKNLSCIEHLYLPLNTYISDYGLKSIPNIKTLVLATSLITDCGLKYIRKLRYLDMVNNTSITDHGLQYIQQIYYLHLSLNKNITDKGLRYIQHVRILKLFSDNLITDNGLKYLSKTKHLSLNSNNKITNKGIRYLKKIKYLNLTYNYQITTGILPYIIGTCLTNHNLDYENCKV